MKPIFMMVLCISVAVAAEEWRACTSYADVVRMYPDKVDLVFAAFDLKRPELAAVKTAWEGGDKVGACAALVTYLRTSPAGEPFRTAERAFNQEIADNALEDTFVYEGITGTNPRLPDGGLQWLWPGPKELPGLDWLKIGRHEWMPHLLFAGLRDGGEPYLDKLDDYLRDWCVHTERNHAYLTRVLSKEEGIQDDRGTGKNPEPTPWNRKLNAGIRLRAEIWPTVFFSFLESERFRETPCRLAFAVMHEAISPIRRSFL